VTHDLLNAAGPPFSFAVRAAGPNYDVERVLATGTSVEVRDTGAGTVGRAIRFDVVDLVEKGPQFPGSDVPLNCLLEQGALITREHKVGVVHCLTQDLQSTALERGIVWSCTGLDLEYEVGVHAGVQLAWGTGCAQLLPQVRTVRATLSVR